MNTPKSPKVAETEIESEITTTALRGEIAALRSEFQALVGQAAATGSAATGAATSTLRAQAAKGMEAGEHVAADMMEEWREIDRKVVSATRDNPWRTLGVAGLIGLVLGLILRR